MNILLSAYACEPNKGSEPGVGWNWAIEIAKHHNVWVITRDNNESAIVSYMKEHPEYQNLDNLHFIYVGLSKKMTFWKKGRRGMRLFYMMWQKKAAKIANRWHEKVKFDLVHHVTFVSYTQPTYMYKLGIPMIWGPVAGGENIPNCIHVKMSKRDTLLEFLRNISQTLTLFTPAIYKTMNYSKYILVATEETKNKVPAKYQSKTIIMPAIGLEKLPNVKVRENENDIVRIVMAGRLINWKAFDIGILAFLKIADKYPCVTLHILGEGNKKEELKKLAGSYLDKQIFFEKPVLHSDIYNFYQGFDIFLNTTLRDSGCMTMMEAMSVGLPCVCIATGGPKILAKDINFSQVQPNANEKVILEIISKLEILIRDHQNRKKYSLKSVAAVKGLLLKNKVKSLEKLYKN